MDVAPPDVLKKIAAGGAGARQAYKNLSAEWERRLRATAADRALFDGFAGELRECLRYIFQFLSDSYDNLTADVLNAVQDDLDAWRDSGSPGVSSFQWLGMKAIECGSPSGFAWSSMSDEGLMVVWKYIQPAPAFETIYGTYARVALYWCAKQSVPDGVAEDLVQDALLEALVTGHLSYADCRPFRPWLITIVRYRWWKVLRKPWWRKEISESDLPVSENIEDPLRAFLDSHPDPAPDPEEAAIRQEFVEKVRELRDPPQFEAQRYYIDRAKVEEIAEERGISINAVKSRLRLARKLLLERLDGRSRGHSAP